MTDSKIIYEQHFPNPEDPDLCTYTIIASPSDITKLSYNMRAFSGYRITGLTANTITVCTNDYLLNKIFKRCKFKTQNVWQKINVDHGLAIKSAKIFMPKNVTDLKQQLKTNKDKTIIFIKDYNSRLLIYTRPIRVLNKRIALLSDMHQTLNGINFNTSIPLIAHYLRFDTAKMQVRLVNGKGDSTICTYKFYKIEDES